MPILALQLTCSEIPTERKYSIRQESTKKKIELIFKIIQSRIKILRRENIRWDILETIRILKKFVTIHNMITTLKQKFDPFLENVTEIAVKNILENEKRVIQPAEEKHIHQKYTHDRNVEAEGYLLRKLRFTDSTQYFRLKDDLLKFKTVLNGPDT